MASLKVKEAKTYDCIIGLEQPQIIWTLFFFFLEELVRHQIRLCIMPHLQVLEKNV